MTRSDRKPEVDLKLSRLRHRMAARQADAVLLNTIPNCSWITAGAATYVNEATDRGASAVLVTNDRVYVLTTNIEAPRLRREEELEALGFEIAAEPWYRSGKTLDTLTAGKHTAQDTPGRAVDMSRDLQQLRSVLQPEEAARLRHVSMLAAEAMDDAIHSVRPGDPEYDLAARLAAACRARGGSAIVNLVASDDRIFQYRHPLPTAKTVERYAMLVLCLRYEGLVAAITRLVHFGPLPDDVRKKALAVARIDATLIFGTRAGQTLDDMFKLAQKAYQDEGYPEAIEEHHQGGTMAYLPREIIARPGDFTVIEAHQAFAWNPSIRGAKAEDTTLLDAEGPVVTTNIPNWPMWTVQVGSQSMERPAILEV
jgi:Xaa-Pro aminopeptidase